MPNINKKALHNKLEYDCSFFGSLQKYKQHDELLDRYADWCSDPISDRDIELAELCNPSTSFSERRIELLELKTCMYEALLLFHTLGFYWESGHRPLKSKNKLKKALRERIKRINFGANKIIARA